MKNIFIVLFCLCVGWQLQAQNCYWVFFTDKKNTTFDPYQYFDAKALERYRQNNIDLYDITNYPLNAEYKAQVEDLTESYVGESRWFNAVAVMATEEEIAEVSVLPFVSATRLIASEAMLAQASTASAHPTVGHYDATLNQVALMQGEKFQQHHFDGKGVRIAVLDGGFTGVDTHPAFRHLRDNHQIIKTWNFVQRKKEVYGYSDHGRMVLSCIAGIMNDTTLLGLAPGAEFLLARTEVEVEKKKEEVWWVQALEWADQNGASIVNSSLGYGWELYSSKDMDGKTSIVAKGARTAADKGILVVTAMGNQGDDYRWRYLITPADVDSVLSVGAVRSLEKIEPYSSFGPTADGRRKPNVVACGYAMVATTNGNYDYSQGTSFATPMVTGFAACVKQMHPNWSAMQLLEEIEKSANHYPYYDYAYGHGVPQAGYFIGETKPQKNTFNLQEDAENLYIIPVDPQNKQKVFCHIQNGDKSIDYYCVQKFYEKKNDSISRGLKVYYIPKWRLQNGQTVNIWMDDQYAQYVVGKDNVPTNDSALFDLSKAIPEIEEEFNYTDDGWFKYKKSIYSLQFVLNASFMVPSMWSPEGNIHQIDRISRSFFFSLENDFQLARAYALGVRIGFGSSWYALSADFSDPAGMMEPLSSGAEVRKYNMKTTQFDLELYQRFCLAYIRFNKIYLDTGVYGDWITGGHLKCKQVSDNQTNKMVEKRYFRDGIYKLNAGVRLRLGLSDTFAIYGQYRITSILKEGNDLPKWEVGIQIF